MPGGPLPEPLPSPADTRIPLASPVPIAATTPVDPKQAEATAGWQQYSSELQAGTAAETERELQRYRDQLSTGMASEGEAAIARGADPSLFRSRALESGKRGMLELQGRLADVSLGRRAQALGGFTSAAGAAAAERRMLHLGTLSAQQEAQRTLLEQASVQARLREAPYERLLKMMDTTGRYADVFAGLTGGPARGGISGGGRPQLGGGLGGGRLGVTPR